MASSTDLERIREGVAPWNEWRAKNWKSQPDLREANLNRANLNRANLRGADLGEAYLRGADLNLADLREANLTGADLTGADLNRADLRGTDLRETNLRGANLRGTDLSRANLSGQELWRAADLTGAHLSGADLTGAHLTGAHLSGADFIGAHLTGIDSARAVLSGADLREAKLTGAHLWGAELSSADLRGADLREANLREANLRGAKLQKANLTGATLNETVFANVDLTQTLGLESCRHDGPSVLDIRTLIGSGQLPINFLRGCGVPETLITYLPSLSNQPIQFYSCFISYSTVDQDFADRLYADLQHNGVRCWFAPHHIQAGKKIHEQLDEAIRVYDRLLLILSEASMESAWVETEIAHARQKEVNEHRRVLFPIGLVTFSQIRRWKLFDAETGKDSAREIREYFIPDFSNWKDHDLYQKAFDRILTSLKQDDRPPTSVPASLDLSEY